MMIQIPLIMLLAVQPDPEAGVRDFAHLAADAVSADEAIAQAARAQLRAAGPEGLAALFDAHGESIKQYRAGGDAQWSPEEHESWSRLHRALDHVSAQRDAYSSRLYWYTDLHEAVARARQTGKPVLSLRLLGRLDEELSCANSRFFRSLLYPNAAISKQMRDDFVLHWSTERPIPRIRIDFGDGRYIHRTVTGNSIHYILDRDGRVVDAIPGLLSPQAFAGALRTAHKLAADTVDLPPNERAKAVRSHHAAQRHETVLRLSTSLGLSADVIRTRLAAPTKEINRVEAAVAANIAFTKAGVEVVMLNAMNRPSMTGATNPWWHAITPDRRVDLPRFDARTTEMLRRKHASASGQEPDAFARMLRRLRVSTALDSARNRLYLHTRIHDWFANGEVAGTEALNQRVYAELFLTPKADPWLGLVAPDTYAAIDHGGIFDGQSAEAQALEAGTRHGASPGSR